MELLYVIHENTQIQRANKSPIVNIALFALPIARPDVNVIVVKRR